MVFLLSQRTVISEWIFILEIFLIDLRIYVIYCLQRISFFVMTQEQRLALKNIEITKDAD